MRQPTAATHTLRLLIVDDHPMVLQGLRTMLLDAGDIDVVAEAADAATAIAVVRRTALDLFFDHNAGCASLR